MTNDVPTPAGQPAPASQPTPAGRPAPASQPASASQPAPAGQPATPSIPAPGEWLVVIDPQIVFASPEASPWGSPLWATTMPRITELVAVYGRDRTVITRFVADAALGGSWEAYYEEWPFALVPGDDRLYDVVDDLAGVAAHVVTEPTFGKWGPSLRSIVGSQPRLALAGVSTDCCVIATALPAADAGATVRVFADACAGSTPENHDRALRAMALFGPQITIV